MTEQLLQRAPWATAVAAPRASPRRRAAVRVSASPAARAQLHTQTINRGSPLPSSAPSQAHPPPPQQPTAAVPSAEPLLVSRRLFAPKSPCLPSGVSACGILGAAACQKPSGAHESAAPPPGRAWEGRCWKFARCQLCVSPLNSDQPCITASLGPSNQAYEIVQGPLVRYSTMGPGRAPPTAVLVHGILGKRQNMLSFARRLVEGFPHWQVRMARLSRACIAHPLVNVGRSASLAAHAAAASQHQSTSRKV